MIRRRTDADVAACVDALRPVQRADSYPGLWPDDPVAFLSPDGLLDAWVAVDDGDVVGQAGLRAARPDEPLLAALDEPAERVAVVCRLFVVPAARRAGHARALATAAARGARDRNLLAALDVDAEALGAVRSYERMGWRRVGDGTATWARPDGRRPPVVYFAAPDRIAAG